MYPYDVVHHSDMSEGKVFVTYLVKYFMAFDTSFDSHISI